MNNKGESREFDDIDCVQTGYSDETVETNINYCQTVNITVVLLLQPHFYFVAGTFVGSKKRATPSQQMLSDGILQSPSIFQNATCC